MRSLGQILKHGSQLVKSNSPGILTGLGVVGVVSTAYLAARASFTARDIILSNEEDDRLMDSLPERKDVVRYHIKHTWKLYIPAGVSGVVTVGCILGAAKASTSRTAAAVTAYSVTEKAFSDYREKVVEEIGKNKEQKIRDSVMQDTITKTPGSTEVIIAGTGHVLCCEVYTGRYFRSDMEILRRVQNDINAKIVNQMYVPLDEFYDAVGLSHTSESDKLGWDSIKLMELKFSAVMSENNEPCMAFEYNYVKPL